MAGLNKVTVEDINVKGKKVLVRVDFNVPLKDGVITNDNRIQAALPTIKKLVSDGGKIVLCSHLGKPKNGPEDKFSLAPAAERLAQLVDTKVVFAKDDSVVGENAKKAVSEMNDGEIVVLENTRFRGADETKNGESLAKELADLVDNEVFVMDAFGSAHRAHASTAGVTKFVKETAVGYLMQKEIQYLGNAVEVPVRPFVAILGGAKVADKLNVISNLLEKCDTLLAFILFLLLTFFDCFCHDIDIFRNRHKDLALYRPWSVQCRALHSLVIRALIRRVYVGSLCLLLDLFLNIILPNLICTVKIFEIHMACLSLSSSFWL